ncbi:putative DNA binding domain-containing protein [Cellulomonas sp. DKR-3]|uniref:DNA binding domain-containing protein n=1 Tax=Cellulomonas fulva TaxID=2835530 RepID=A0ABS5U2P1_9CELL|nr:ATP-binding protein [Cellulomonas fulva]MBT0995663.1 putative DNA binding domain-containing protein [Cellulomonas fulva]
MPTSWSRIHEALGAPRGPLTYELVARAVAANVSEADDLDWKSDQRSDEAARAELAKDIAAMANTAGGVLVIGVAEKGKGAEKALELSPVALGEQAEQQVRAVNVSRVRPVVQGVEVAQLPCDSRPGYGVVVVYIPRSPDAPHFVERRESTIAPWRNGSHTDAMLERQIERAYADRFARRQDEHARLERLFESTAERLAGEHPWLVGVSRPRSPAGLSLSSPDRDAVTAAVARAAAIEEETLWEGVDVQSGPGQALARIARTLVTFGDAAVNPRKGLRRWVLRRDSDQTRLTGLVYEIYAEFHDDGSTSLALPVRAPRQLEAVYRDDSLLPSQLVETASVALASLATAWAESLGLGGAIALSLESRSRVTPAAKLTRAVTRRVIGGLDLGYEVADWTIGLKRVLPAEADLIDPAAVVDRRHVSRQLTEDVVNQFGLRGVESLVWPVPGPN